MENDFTVHTHLTVSDPKRNTACKMMMRKGELLFNAHDRSFTAKIQDKTLIQLLPAHLCKLRRKMCPNGGAYIIRFQRVSDQNPKELALKGIEESDKQRVHAVLLALVGVEQGTVLKRVPMEQKVQSEESSVKLAELKAKVIPFGESPARFMEFPGRRRPLVVCQLSELDERAKLHRPAQISLENVPTYANITDFCGIKANTSMEKSSVEIRSPKQWFKHTSAEQQMNGLELEEIENIEGPDIGETVPQNAHPLPLAEAGGDDLDISMPDHELALPELFIRSNFWAELTTDKRLRSGESGEWVKGQDERLTIDGLFCLRDGQWLNADIIDCFLERICQQSAQAQFIPTYAILSYERKGKLPSEWYWPLSDTTIIFAPAHLYTNHWAMAVLDVQNRTLRLMDSMNHGYTCSEKTTFMDTIMNIVLEVAEMQGVNIGERSTWDVQELLAVPQQRNGTDCGIFALLFAQYALERREFDFDQRHIPYFRRRICHDIISVLLFDQ